MPTLIFSPWVNLHIPPFPPPTSTSPTFFTFNSPDSEHTYSAQGKQYTFFSILYRPWVSLIPFLEETPNPELARFRNGVPTGNVDYGLRFLPFLLAEDADFNGRFWLPGYLVTLTFGLWPLGPERRNDGSSYYYNTPRSKESPMRSHGFPRYYTA